MEFLLLCIFFATLLGTFAAAQVTYYNINATAQDIVKNMLTVIAFGVLFTCITFIFYMAYNAIK